MENESALNTQSSAITNMTEIASAPTTVPSRRPAEAAIVPDSRA
jgi:hypothetical protein